MKKESRCGIRRILVILLCFMLVAGNLGTVAFAGESVPAQTDAEEITSDRESDETTVENDELTPEDDSTEGFAEEESSEEESEAEVLSEEPAAKEPAAEEPATVEPEVEPEAEEPGAVLEETAEGLAKSADAYMSETPAEDSDAPAADGDDGIIDSGTCGASDDNLTWVLTDDGTLTISGNGSMKDYNDSYAPWYSNEASITSVVLEPGVASIGNDAFRKCTAIKSVTIPDSVTRIGEYAFWDCDSLLSVTIPDDVKIIDTKTFYSCDSLESVTIGRGTTNIITTAFAACDSLKSITIDKNNPVFHSDGNCIIYTKEKTLEVGCIGSVIPSDGSVTKIEYRSFAECHTLKELIIPEGVTTIGREAFYGCTGLKSVTIPVSMTTINPLNFDDFGGCALTDIYYNGTKEQWGNIKIYSDNNRIENADIHYALLGFGTCGANGDNLTWVLKSDGTLTISGEGEMKDYEQSSIPWEKYTNDITSIVIEPGVTSIGGYAFYYCPSLTSVTIGNNVKSIGKYAFCQCKGLTSVTIPNGVTSIEDGTFYLCSSLESVTIGSGVTSIGVEAFKSCTSLSSVTIPDGVTSIGQSAFLACSGLTSVTIGSKVTSIGEAAFDNCTSLTSVTIPVGITEIEKYTFYNCTSLKDVYYGGSEEQWNAITIGVRNDPLLNATIHYMDLVVTIKGVTGSFNDKIKLNYYFAIPEEVLAYENAYVTITNESGGGYVKLPVSEAMYDEEKGGYGFGIELAAKRASDSITAKFFDGLGRSVKIIGGQSGEDYTKNGVQYSLMRYFTWLENNGTDKEKAIGAAAKDYCVAAQIYFGYNADGLAVSDKVSGMSEEDLGKLNSNIAGREGTLPPGVSIKGISAMLESDNTLRLYFDFEDVNPDSLVFSIDGNEVELKKRSDGARYLALDTGVYSNKLQVSHTYSVWNGTYTYKITASVLTYARSCAIKSNKTESDLGKALYLYNKAAVAKFGE